MNGWVDHTEIAAAGAAFGSGGHGWKHGDEPVIRELQQRMVEWHASVTGL